jgi:hypothetical protein
VAVFRSPGSFVRLFLTGCSVVNESRGLQHARRLYTNSTVVHPGLADVSN